MKGLLFSNLEEFFIGRTDALKLSDFEKVTNVYVSSSNTVMYTGDKHFPKILQFSCDFNFLLAHSTQFL